MSEGNLRQQVVKSLMLAIDLENGNQDLEAYLKYLEGLSFVVTALQKDATNGDQWLFTDKVRRSLVNFAKESVDRIILLLKKQDRITDKKQEVLATSVINTPYSDISPVKADENTSDSFNSEQKEIKQDVFGPLNKSVIDDNSFLSYSSAEEEIDAPLSPLEAVRIENSQLSKKYAHRIINAPVFQRPQLRLELERHIAENIAIAENKQLVWDAEKEKATLHYRQLAQQKCKQLKKPKEGDCSNTEAELQDVTYSCFMFEWENKLRTMHGTLEVSKLENANEELLRRAMKKSMDMGVRALMGSIRGHPLGSFMVKRQQSVYHEISSILSSNQVPEASMKEVHVVLDSSAKDSKGPLFMFYRIADEMKKDLESLEIILLSLYGPLNNNEGNILLSKTLQKIYFPALTPSIKALLRLCMNSQKPGSEVDQHTLCRNFTSGNSTEDEASVNSIQNASEMEARFRLMSLQSLPSPCEKLDCLTEVMRSLCSWKYGSPKAGAKENVQPIGADDLLSRLVSVIHSGATGEESLSHLLRMEAIFLETFLPDNMVLGEAGYCVTVLCSALSI